VTENKEHAEQFLKGVDSAAVLHNASTRLHDGGVFGLGAEIGFDPQIARPRDHGSQGTDTTKYIVRGTGQVRE